MGLPKSTKAETAGFADYDWVVVYLFRKLTRRYTSQTLPNAIPFTLDDVRQAAARALAAGVLKKQRLIKNVPDIKYRYDARADLPKELTQVFPLTWLSTCKGKYVFRRTKRKNLIDLTGIRRKPPLEYVIDQTPPFVSRLMGSDEQAVFARARYAGLFNQTLGFQTSPVQGHHRTSVTYGQVEIDEVQAGLEGQTGMIVPISGKGGQDRLSWSQVLNLNTYGQKCLARYEEITSPLKGVDVRSLCLWLDKKTNEFWIAEFSNHLEIDRIRLLKLRRFKFVTLEHRTLEGLSCAFGAEQCEDRRGGCAGRRS